MAYTVTAPLVIARQDDGRDVYLYAGADVPSNIGRDEVKRLREGGFIADPSGDEADAEVGEPVGSPDESWKVADLKAYAERQEIDLGGATTKSDILAALARQG